MTMASTTAFAADVNLKCTLSGKNIATKSTVIALQADEESGSDYLKGNGKLGELSIEINRFSEETKIVLYHSCGFLGLGCTFGGHGSDVGIPTGKDYTLSLDVTGADGRSVGYESVTLKHSYSKGTVSLDGQITPAGQQNEIAINVSCQTL